MVQLNCHTKENLISSFLFYSEWNFFFLDIYAVLYLRAENIHKLRHVIKTHICM